MDSTTTLCFVFVGQSLRGKRRNAETLRAQNCTYNSFGWQSLAGTLRTFLYAQKKGEAINDTRAEVGLSKFK